MSRFKRLRDWPERLKRMSADELSRERAYWQGRIEHLGHPAARKEVLKRVREIEKEMNSRE